MGSNPGPRLPPRRRREPAHVVEVARFGSAASPSPTGSTRRSSRHGASPPTLAGRHGALGRDSSGPYVSDTTPPPFPGQAWFSRPRRSGRRRQRRRPRLWPWVTSRPTAPGPCSMPASAGPASPGAACGRRPAGRSTWPGTWPSGWRAAYAPTRPTATKREPRVVRGGSYIHGADALRCSARRPLLSGAIDTYVGFRVAADRARLCPSISISSTSPAAAA